LPFYSKYLHAKLREPDEINIHNIKNRVVSNPIEHEEIKSKLKLENKLKKEYTPDEQHQKICKEIDKTLKELYGEENYNNNYNNNNNSFKKY
jgi:hypothetical protein